METLEQSVIFRELGLEGVEVSAGQKLYGVMPGDKVRVKARIEYRGPAWDDYFYAAIGNKILGVFDEIWSASVSVRFAASADWTPYELTVDVPITKVAKLPWTPGWFDLYVKLDTAQGKAGYPELSDVIEVILAAEFQNFTIVSYDKIAGA